MVDIGINFRGTSGGATDPVGTTYCLNDTYPTTRGGFTFGFNSIGGFADRAGSPDPRLAGILFAFDSSPMLFRLDGLSAGSLTFHLALGDTDAHGPQSFKLIDSDGTTVLYSFTTAALSAGTYFDATNTNYSAASWGASETGHTVTISGTSVYFQIGDHTTGGDYHTVAHFRVVQGDAEPVTAGTASFHKSGPSSIEIHATDATDGAAPYTYQWQRNEDGGSFSNLSNGVGVSGATSLSLVDGSAEEGILYGYRIVYTDDDTDTATSNTVTAEVYTGGIISAIISYFTL